MACPSGSKESAQGSSLEQLIEEINFQRAKEMRQLLKDDSGFVMLHGAAYWTDLFVRHFLMEEDRSAQESDDLLFFIRKRHLKEAKKHVPKYETMLEVQRRDSKKLPIGEPDIDWEETIYANLIIQRFDYYVTLAVCTRTSAKELQVLRRHTERVWASPSRRLMSDKGTSEEITYPNICFMLDNFDEAFTEIVVRDGEMVSVELVARDRTGALQSVIFLGSVRYDALRRVYDARTSLTARVAQRMTFGLYSAADAPRMEFVRVRGPMGKGHAELAVTKPPGDPAAEEAAEENRTPAEDSTVTPTDTSPKPAAEKPVPEGDATATSSLQAATGDGGAEAELQMDAIRSCSAASAAASDGDSERRPPAASEASRQKAEARRDAGQFRHVPSPGDPPGPQAVSGGAGANDEGAQSTITGTTTTGTAASSPASATAATSASAAAAAAAAATVPGQPTGGRRASCSDAGRNRPGSRPAVVTPGMLYRRACGQDGARAAARCACARTPDGTVVHYGCHVQQAFLRQRELEDGICNSMWTMRGFSQPFLVWKETKRSSGLPLSTYLTYVMLPWHTIIADLIAKENRQDPILSF